MRQTLSAYRKESDLENDDTLEYCVLEKGQTLYYGTLMRRKAVSFVMAWRNFFPQSASRLELIKGIG